MRSTASTTRHRRLRPPLPAGPAAARARRAVCAGLERGGRADEQLGQPQRHPQASCRRSPGASTGRSPALLRDLKARGLLDDTLVVFSTEFGRQPFTQGATGRDHNGGTSVAWLAGAGVKGGVAHGESDPWAWRAATGQTYCYDLHATILHLMGIDHTRLTFRHNGIDRRLTDVHGHVIDAILA